MAHFDTSSNRENIEKILDFLQDSGINDEIIVALTNLLKRAERANFVLRQLGAQPPDDSDSVIVQMPDMERAAHIRVVPLIEYTILCNECKKWKTFKRYPGPKPNYCPDCKAKYRRKSKTESQQRYREKMKGKS